MSLITRAASASGTTLVPLCILFWVARDTRGIEISMDSLVGLLIGLAFLWALGASLAFVLLMPLKPIADRAPPWLSVPIFTVIGFSVAALVDYQLIHVGAHGQPPPIETEPWTDLALGMVAMGLMGAGCAVASWLSIKRTARRDDSKQARR